MNDHKPWEEYPDIWPTKSKFFTWLRGCLRQAVWNRYPGKLQFKNENCSTPPEGYSGRAKSGAYCALSGEWEGKSKLEVDHCRGNVSLRDWEDVTPFIQHLCASKDNMQLVTKEAHKIKSYAEKQGIFFEEAVIEKDVIAFSKLPTEAQKAKLEGLGCKDIPKTKEGRKNEYKRILNEQRRDRTTSSED